MSTFCLRWFLNVTAVGTFKALMLSLNTFHVVKFRVQQYIFLFYFLVFAHIDCWPTAVCMFSCLFAFEHLKC